MGLQARLLLGLAVLVTFAIASAGWLTVSVARGALDGAEEERARGMGDAAAGLVGRALDGAAGLDEAARREWLEGATSALVGLGGIIDVAVVDTHGRARYGDAASDPGLAVTARGGATLARRSGGVLAVYAPVRGYNGERLGALRLRVAVGANLDEAVGGSTRLLAAVTLFDGALILLFGALFLRTVVRPLEAAARSARRVAAGDLDGPPVEGGAGEVKALADALNRMTASLREERAHLAESRAQVVAQEKLATVGRLAAGVAHEIGNPLTAVLGYVEILLADEPADSPRTDLLTRVQGETTRIHRIVHDLLEYARPVSDGVEPVSVGEVIEAALSLLAPQPRFRGVTVEKRIDPALPPAAASSRRLLQVLLNLLLNAADAMGDDGTVRITARLDGERVIVEVADSGPGVAPADRERIFDPFFSTKDPGKGTGLGLAVCRSLVSAFGGEIALAPSAQSAQSAQSDRGATFRVTLPRWKDQ